MSNYRLQLTPITPLHIGTGEVLEPFQYVILADNKLYRFELEKLIKFLSRNDQEEFLKVCDGEQLVPIRDFVAERVTAIQKAASYTIPVTSSTAGTYQNRLDGKGQRESDLSLYPCMRTLKGTYIPGSSLKGALRTAILYHFVQKPITGKDAKRLEAETFKYARYNQAVYHRPDIKYDPFRAIKISDSRIFKDITIIDEVKVFSKNQHGNWHEGGGPATLREVTRSELTKNITCSRTFAHSLKPAPSPVGDSSPGKLNAKGGDCQSKPHVNADKTGNSYTMNQDNPFVLQLIIDDNVYKLNKNLKKIECDTIIKACKEFYGLHLKKELDKLSNHPEASAAYDLLSKRENRLDENSFLIRFGWGTGFDGMTVNYACRYPAEKKTRRLVDGMPLGWAKITLQAV